MGSKDWIRALSNAPTIPPGSLFFTIPGAKGRCRFYAGRQIGGLRPEGNWRAHRLCAGVIARSGHIIGTNYATSCSESGCRLLTTPPVKERLFVIAKCRNPAPFRGFQEFAEEQRQSSSDRTIALTLAAAPYAYGYPYGYGYPAVTLVTPTTVAVAILSQGELGPLRAGVFAGSRYVTEIFPQGAPHIQQGHRWIAFCANSKLC